MKTTIQLKNLWTHGFRVLIAIIGLLLFSITSVNAQIVTGTGKFLGNIAGSSIPSNFATYWNQISPENAGKWGSVEGTKDVMNFTQLKTMYDFAKSKGYKFKQHTLVWGSQYPSWITSLSAADQKAQIIEWYQALATNFPDMDMIDVVNEPIKTACPFKAALGGDGTTGWDWVIEAFTLARQYFPKAQLLINEYGTENDPSARKKYIDIINLLKAKNLIDGIGIQAHHFNVDYMKGADMTKTLDEYNALALPVYVSELDIIGPSDNASEDNQLAQYKEIFPAIWNHPAVKGVTLWGYIVGQTWRANTGIVNADGTERSAMKWLKEFVGGVVSTDSLKVTPLKLDVAAAASSNTITVASNISWTVGNSNSWITTSVSSGSKSGSFTINVSENTGTASRTGNVTVSSGSLTNTIVVTQAGSSVTATYTIASSAGANGTISPMGSVSVNSGTSQSFTITANSGYEVADVLVNNQSVGAVATYTFNNVTANQTIAASFKVVSSTGTACLLTRFGVPRSTPLPSTTSNSSFSKVYVLGTGGPNLSNVTNTVLNWDLANKGLWQLSFSTNNGIPAWWVDMRNNANTFSQASPSITFKGVGIANLDNNTYYVNVVDANNIVLVEKAGTHAIYFSNSATAPIGCSSARIASAYTARVMPNPVTGATATVEVPGFENSEVMVVVYEMEGGRKLMSYKAQVVGNRLQLNTKDLKNGSYRLMILDKAGDKTAYSRVDILK